MKGLTGKRIGVAADRKSDAICRLIQNMGGTAAVFPSQGIQRLNEEISIKNIKDYLNTHFEWVILTTGIGARTLAQSASTIGLKDQFIEKLLNDSLAIRGSKTVDWLKENDLKPTILADDGTMESLFKSLPAPVSKKSSVFLQAYHQDDALLKQKLNKAGYDVYLSQPYSFEPPSAKVVSQLKEEVFRQEIDAVVFTSKTQVKNVFNEDRQKLVESFSDQVLAVAVGKVTAKELENQGIEYVLQPNRPKMGAMVVEIDRYYQKSLTI